MRRRTRLGLALSLVVVLLVAGVAVTAANVVADSKAGVDEASLDPNDLKPAECAAIHLTDIRGPAPGGGNAGALILGTPAGESLNGNGGDDCILGAGGDDNLRGNGGYDVCIGGPGVDTFHSSCEVKIQ
jgi:Ca2+-binding RTX toxin-like protein